VPQFEQAGWNDPELLGAFTAYREGHAGNSDLESLRRPLEPWHVNELEHAGLELWDSNPHGPEYSFTDEAIRAVGQTGAYLHDLSVPKMKLFLASVTQMGRGALRFARLYGTERTFNEIMAYIEYEMLENAHRERLGEPTIPLLSLHDIAQFSGSRKTGEERPDSARETTILWPNSEETVGGEVISIFSGGRTTRREAVVQVMDYMTLGHLIQFDMNNLS